MDFFEEPKYRGSARKLQPDTKEVGWFEDPVVYRSIDHAVAGLSLDDLPPPQPLRKSSQGKNLSFGLRYAPEPVKPLPIPDFPAYHEPRSSFFTSNIEALGEISKDLQAISGVEVLFLQNAHKIKCCAYFDGDSCTFRVHMFKAQVKGQYLIEFQRRAGCCVVFRRVYSKVSSRFLPKSGRKEQLKVAPLDIVRIDDVTAAFLVNMISVSKSDQQRDALRLLAHCSTLEDNRNKIVVTLGLAKLTAVLLEAITSGDRDFERYACVLLANLCQFPSEHKDSVQREVVDKMFSPLCALLSLDSLGSSETKRHVQKCIDSLSPSLVGEVRARHSEAIKSLSFAAQRKDRFQFEVQ